MHRLSIRGLLLVVVALTATALAATFISAQDNPWKGETFLSDYSTLKPVPTKTGQDYTYLAPGADERLAQVDAVMVDQPEISISGASPYKSAKPDDLKAISEFMRSAVIERLKARGFKVVDQPGERVLYLRAALTDLQLKKKKRGILAYTPIGAVVHGVASAVQGFMKEVDIIDMAGQAELSGSQTGDVLGAMVAKRGVSASPTSGGKIERMTFEQFKAHVDEMSDRLVCRLENSRRPADQRIDCSDPAGRIAPGGGPTAK